MSTVSRLGEFRGVPAPRELCRDIAEASSFQNTKKANESEDMPAYFEGDKTDMYRRGQFLYKHACRHVQTRTHANKQAINKQSVNKQINALQTSHK